MFLSNLAAVSLISLIGTSSFIAGTLILQDDKTRRAGLMSELSLECNTCHESTPLSTSKSVTQRGTSYDINRRAVYHAIETGSGYEGLAAFCSIMNMPCLTKAAYYKQVENILEALENEANEEMRNAGERLRQHILDENPEKDERDILGAAVSFDGTWAKRGFTSLTGVVFAISVDTGEVLDYHVLSKSRLKCTFKKKNAVMKSLKSGCLNMSVILTLLVVHQPWRVKELLSCGVDQLIITTSGISGQTASLLSTWRVIMVQMEAG